MVYTLFSKTDRTKLPRERLFTEGSETLTDTELVAIFLRTGTKGKSVLRLAEEILQKSRGVRGLFEIKCEQLLEIPGLGPAKISEIKAAYELARRYLKEKIHKKDVLASPREVCEYFQYTLRHLKEEIFQVVFLNAQNEVIKILTLSQGCPHTTFVSLREIVKQALDAGAASLILVHNHPGGKAAPSSEDLEMTQNLIHIVKPLGIRICEHLIVGQNDNYSFAGSGMLK